MTKQHNWPMLHRTVRPRTAVSRREIGQALELASEESRDQMGSTCMGGKTSLGPGMLPKPSDSSFDLGEFRLETRLANLKPWSNSTCPEVCVW